MTREKQLETLHKIRELNFNIAWNNDELRREQNRCFPSPPAAPTMPEIRKSYPVVKSNRKYDWKTSFGVAGAGILLSIMFITISSIIPIGFFWYLSSLANIFFACAAIIWPIGFTVWWYEKRKQDVNNILNSAEYKAKCAQIDLEYKAAVEKATNTYNNAVHEYKTVTIPKYEEEKRKFEEVRNSAVQELKHKLEEDNKELDFLYDSTKILPSPYRSVNAIEFITNYMDTSDASIEDAILSYDRNLQLDLDNQKLSEQIRENDIKDRMANAQEAANDIAERNNEIAEQTRRDANRAAFIAAVQRHNTNKHLKRM